MFTRPQVRKTAQFCAFFQATMAGGAGSTGLYPGLAVQSHREGQLPCLPPRRVCAAP